MRDFFRPAESSYRMPCNKTIVKIAKGFFINHSGLDIPRAYGINSYIFTGIFVNNRFRLYRPQPRSHTYRRNFIDEIESYLSHQPRPNSVSCFSFSIESR